MHPLPPVLQPGPGSFTVLTGSKPQWRAIPLAAAAALQAAKQASDTIVQAADAAANAAAATPAGPAAKAAAEATKAAALSAMGSAIAAASGGADIHMCATPLPIAPHGPGVVINGSPTVLVNNLPAARMGDTILEALGPPNKIVMGQFNVDIGGSANSGGGGAGGAGGAIGALIAMVIAMIAPEYPRPIVLPDGRVGTEYSPNVFVVGTPEEQAETIRQLNAIREGDGGDAFFEELAQRDTPQVVNVIGDPARGRELHPGQQSYENCAVQSSQQIINQATGVNNDEATMEGIANGPPPSGYTRDGGTPIGGEETILENGGVPAHMEPGNTTSVDNALANGQGVVSGHDAGALWNDPAYDGGGHAVHTTGAVQNEQGETLGYTINDTGTDQNGRVINHDDYANSMDGGDIAVTDNPIW